VIQHVGIAQELEAANLYNADLIDGRLTPPASPR
jgi:hypothetical protein